MTPFDFIEEPFWQIANGNFDCEYRYGFVKMLAEEQQRRRPSEDDLSVIMIRAPHKSFAKDCSKFKKYRACFLGENKQTVYAIQYLQYSKSAYHDSCQFDHFELLKMAFESMNDDLFVEV